MGEVTKSHSYITIGKNIHHVPIKIDIAINGNKFLHGLYF